MSTDHEPQAWNVATTLADLRAVEAASDRVLAELPVLRAALERLRDSRADGPATWPRPVIPGAALVVAAAVLLILM
jgi:hypothetical protein